MSKCSILFVFDLGKELCDWLTGCICLLLFFCQSSSSSAFPSSVSGVHHFG